MVMAAIAGRVRNPYIGLGGTARHAPIEYP
jgi:hypothetical protein